MKDQLKGHMLKDAAQVEIVSKTVLQVTHSDFQKCFE
jgi:hypothetical protein